MAKILVVDDRPDGREYLVTLLGYQKHDLLQAADGAEALAVARAEHPDLVITDILMPTMDGYEFVRQLRADPAIASTAVIFCTADYLGREARNLASSCGVSHLLVKPCEPAIVLRTVEAALGHSVAPLASPPEPEFDRDHLSLLTNKLSEKANELHLSNQRLAELIQVNLQLAAENDTYRLLTKVCGSARSLTGAKYAAVGLGHQDEARAPCYFVTSGMSGATADDVPDSVLHDASLTAMLTELRACRLSQAKGNLHNFAFPSREMPAQSLLAAPITSLAHHYGWLYLTDKLGRDEFSEEDEQLMSILAAQVGRIYENQTLHAHTLRHAAEVEREVAERKEAVLQLRRLNEELDARVAQRTAELEAANRELEAFSYSVSHDLRAPLRAIDGFAMILFEDFAAELSPDARDCVTRIRDNAGRMDLLIRDLLAFARLAQQPMHKHTVATTAVLHEVLEEVRSAHPGRNILVDIADLPQCQADRSLLRQVWMNLLSNAFKYTRDRDPARITIGCDTGTRELVFFVKDNGCGFDMKHAHRLFGVFQRLHRAEDFDGTGIGLSLVRRIVNRHGGRVWAEAACDLGATFYFSLPVQVSDRNVG
jgi:signal transduction histidine kinase/CheY-like chemotaxis protein